MKISNIIAALGFVFAQAVRLSVIDAVLTSPPRVVAPITRDNAAKVVQMETLEKVMDIADGVEYMFWTLAARSRVSFCGCMRGMKLSSVFPITPAPGCRIT